MIPGEILSSLTTLHLTTLIMIHGGNPKRTHGASPRRIQGQNKTQISHHTIHNRTLILGKTSKILISSSKTRMKVINTRIQIKINYNQMKTIM